MGGSGGTGLRVARDTGNVISFQSGAELVATIIGMDRVMSEKNPRDAKRQRLDAMAAQMRENNQANAPKVRKSLPTIVSIARYWSGKDTFDLNWDTPICFACRWFGLANGRRETTEAEWSASGLQRCHLVAHAEGGSSDVTNLVLLCTRCHREAPIVGVSPSPMIEWINRRENYYSWLMRRITEECHAISPTLLEDCAAIGLNGDDFQAAFEGAANFLKLGYHPGGDLTSTAAQVLNVMVQFQGQLKLVLKNVTRRGA